MCMADDADRSTPLGELYPRARKPHRCGECFRTIEPGERYTIHKTLFDGRVDVYKLCAHCDVARAWLGDNCGGWLYGGVWEDIDEHVEEYRSVYPKVALALKRLSVHAEHNWRIVRGPKAGTLLPVPAMPLTVE
jgi:hypothetical protein